MDINAKEKALSIAEAVFNTIEQDILDGNIKSGEILTELKLCELLSVSRTPVREALKRLKQEGMIIESGKGAIVVGISQKDIDDIYKIRLKLEGLACSMCCDNLTDDLVRQLKDTIELQEFYISKGNFENLRNLDSEFHRKIYENCQSRVLSSILIDLHRKVRHYRLNSMKDPQRATEVIAEHKGILEAIIARDKEKAELLCKDHILKAYSCIEKSDK